jgi:hypothetical protein
MLGEYHQPAKCHEAVGKRSLPHLFKFQLLQRLESYLLFAHELRRCRVRRALPVLEYPGDEIGR